MKPSYSIGAKNGLLEQKHLNQLGMAIYLYLWFIDKQPKGTDKVLGGKPITYHDFAKSYPEVPRRTYGLWLEKVRSGGYISLLRLPHGYIVTINKPKKWNTSDVQKSEHDSKSDVQDFTSDVQKSEHVMAGFGTSNIKETVKKQIETSITSVIQAEPKLNQSRDDINLMFDYWDKTVGYQIQSKVKYNRYACSNLLKKFGANELQRLISGVALAHKDRYAPNIADFSELQSNLNKLVAWGNRQRTNDSKVGIVI